jgi:hypothetical protein
LQRRCVLLRRVVNIWGGGGGVAVMRWPVGQAGSRVCPDRFHARTVSLHFGGARPPVPPKHRAAPAARVLAPSVDHCWLLATGALDTLLTALWLPVVHVQVSVRDSTRAVLV